MKTVTQPLDSHYAIKPTNAVRTVDEKGRIAEWSERASGSHGVLGTATAMCDQVGLVEDGSALPLCV